MTPNENSIVSKIVKNFQQFYSSQFTIYASKRSISEEFDDQMEPVKNILQ